ncbi:MAG: acyl transferase [Crocinitomicaceae bacterium]|nr:acyl transferase [Crocinitomicaceae bacterium]
MKSDDDFNDVALQIFRFQLAANPVYKEYVERIHSSVNHIQHYSQIPFLPISFFKTHEVVCAAEVETTFYSSGTTKNNLSRHLVADLELYNQSLLNGFELFFGPVSDYSIFALLPSYHENKNASLLYMVEQLITASGNEGGFFLDDLNTLPNQLAKAKQKNKVMLLGVSYALLDLAEQCQPDLHNILIIETGGMKGRRQELIKSDLHKILKEKFQSQSIGSEYGMTELLSQAWSKGDGVFTCPPWMKILTREYNDPFELIQGKTGGINVIDLANIWSCSFIATQDLGIVNGNQFEIAGRFDDADLRGCNLLVG